MNKTEFLLWASLNNVEPDLAEQIANHAPETDQNVNLYTLKSISVTYSGCEELDIASPATCGFWLIGSCANGDLIVMKTKKPVGEIQYLNHESLFAESYKMAFVSGNLDDFMDLVANNVEPIDYYAAKETNNET